MNLTVIDQLCDRLARPLPGRDAQRRMEPRFSYGRHAGPAAYDARQAAVAIVLHPVDSAPTEDVAAWHFPLTVRPGHMKDHAGQICLPGGAVEAGEDTLQCARREVEEELSPRPGELRIVGRLSPLYVYGTNYMVHPIVFASLDRLVFQPDANEVESVLHVTLGELSAIAPRDVSMERHPIFFDAPAWCFGSHCCWGATAMILAEFQALVDPLLVRR